MGYNTDNLFFIDGAYHPQPGGSFTATQELMSAGATELADDGNAWTQNLIVINGNDLTTSDEMTSLGWYKDVGDSAHLSTIGYDGFNGRELDALFEAADYTAANVLMYKTSTIIRLGGLTLKI